MAKIAERVAEIWDDGAGSDKEGAAAAPAKGTESVLFLGSAGDRELECFRGQAFRNEPGGNQ
jgi:hypothetical protein